MTSKPRDGDSTKDVETDPRAELGLRSPVRDKEKLGDEQYGVTPARRDVSPPSDAGNRRVRCEQCSAELDPKRGYRVDGKEYAYYFCDVTCRDRWNERGGDTSSDTPGT